MCIRLRKYHRFKLEILPRFKEAAAAAAAGTSTLYQFYHGKTTGPVFFVSHVSEGRGKDDEHVGLQSKLRKFVCIRLGATSPARVIYFLSANESEANRL